MKPKIVKVSEKPSAAESSRIEYALDGICRRRNPKDLLFIVQGVIPEGLSWISSREYRAPGCGRVIYVRPMKRNCRYIGRPPHAKRISKQSENSLQEPGTEFEQQEGGNHVQLY